MDLICFPPCIVVGIMDKEVYQEVLEDSAEPSIDMLFPDKETNNFIFQQDNDPKHTAKRIKKWFAKADIEVLDWPAQSPDLNPIENLWSILDSKCKNRKCNTEDELCAVLQEAWNALAPDLLEKLALSMKSRCLAVIKSKGYATKY